MILGKKVREDNARTKKEILHVLLQGDRDYLVFGVLDKFADLANNKKDLDLLLKLLEKHPNPIVRHEVAAQLAKLRMKSPHLFARTKRLVINALLECVSKDKSPTARHEAIEALGYVGDLSVLPIMRTFLSDSDADIRSTTRIAIDILRFRLKKGNLPLRLWKAMFTY